MKLYDFMQESHNDYDTYDTEYDAAVTVCHIDEEDIDDDYDKFCVEILKKVDYVEQTDSCTVIADWIGLIKRNWNKFKAFSDAHWYNSYNDDDDEFIYQWIKEINYYVAGYVSDDFYKTLVEFVDSLD